MNSILKRPKNKISLKEGRYEKLNLKENPFPVNPAINKDNSDIRYNGEIYESKIRETELKLVEESFLKIPQNDANHLRLGYLLDDSYVGRGNGKSAFALDLLKRINKNYCLDISEENNKCFGLYISPEPSGRTKSFYDFVDKIFESILNSNIIEYCLATLRLDAILEKDENFNLGQFHTEEDLISSLNSNKWFSDNSIIIGEIARIILKNEYLNSLSPGFPLFKERSQFYGTFITETQHFKAYYFKELKKGKERLNFIFTDMVNLFLASGFNGAYIFVDDFERIPDFQSDRQKREFATELRTNFFDGVSQNARLGFYNLFLVLHAGVPRLIEKAWGNSGLEQRSPLSPENHNSRHIVVFNKLTHENAVLLIQKYLLQYRINEMDDLLYPFTEESVFLISEKSELNAAGILEKANQLIEVAIQKGGEIIDKEFVESIYGQTKVFGEEIMDDIANEESTDLFQKAKNK